MAMVVFPSSSSKDEVLLKLWEYAKVSKSNYAHKKLTIERCRQLNSIKSFGHISGKLLNVSFIHFPAIIQIKYDSINGHGKMQEVANFFNQKYRVKVKKNKSCPALSNRERTKRLQEKDYEIIDLDIPEAA